MMQIIDEDGFSDGTDIEDDTLVGHNVIKFSLKHTIAIGDQDYVERTNPRILKENLKTIDVSNYLFAKCLSNKNLLNNKQWKVVSFLIQPRNM